MKFSMLILGFLTGVLFLVIIACGSPDFPTATPKLVPKPTLMPTTMPESTPAQTELSSVPTPSPTAAPTIPESELIINPKPTPTPEPKGFGGMADLLAAYSGILNDQSFTPYLLRKAMGDLGTQDIDLPRVVPALFDSEGNLLSSFGAGGETLLVRDIALVPSVVTLAQLPSPQTLPPKAREGIFPNGYESKSPQVKIEILKDAISIETVNELSIPETFSAQQQILILESKYMEEIAPRGAILEFGLRPDGSRDYEILGKSIYKDRDLVLEIFQRKPNPNHPFPDKFPFEIQSLDELSRGDRLVFDAYSAGIAGEYTRTKKRASISAIYPERSIIAMNGSVTAGDSGALIFTLQCGAKKLVGVTLGSLQKYGKETQASVLGINKVLEFIKEHAGISVQAPENRNYCPEPDSELNERIINAVSDGLYDFSFDLCHLKNCSFKDLEMWSPLFEVIMVWKDDPSRVQTIRVGKAFLIGDYAFTLLSADISTLSGPVEGENTEFRHRIIWGDGASQSYEYLEFVDLDSAGNVAIFSRPNKENFPVPEGIPFPIGQSGELELGQVLYTFGVVDFKIFEKSGAAVLRSAQDPAYVIGHSPKNEKLLHFEGSGREEDAGAPICAFRDGECEIIGFVYSPLDKPKDETLNTALTIEFVLDAVQEIACANSLSELCAKRFSSEKNPFFFDQEALRDREDMIKLLAGISTPTHLLLDLIRPDISALSRHDGRLVIFLVDETGALITGSKAIYRASIILSDKYVLTSASAFSLPQMLTIKDEEIAVDTSDITSNVVVSGGGGRGLEIRVALLGEFVEDQEALNLFEYIPFLQKFLVGISEPDFFANMNDSELRLTLNYLWTILHSYDRPELVEEIKQVHYDPELLQELMNERRFRHVFREIIHKMEILKVIRIDRENGYALLERPPSSVRRTPFIGNSFSIVSAENIEPDKDIFVAYSQDIFVFEGSLTQLKLVSPGTSTYATPGSAMFIFNGFVSEENLGAPVFMSCETNFCLLGMVAQTHSVPDKIQTEGFGLPIDFIFKKIKEKTGIDLYEEADKKK